MNSIKKSIVFSILSLSSFLQADHTTKKIDTLEDEIAFWAFQEKEHVEFCIDFTDDQKLKDNARTLASSFEKLHQNPKNAKKEFLSLTKQAKKLQNNVKKSLKKDHPDNSIRKDLIDHMNLEASHVEKKLNGKISPQDEIKFWIEEHKGEAKATAYFIKDKDDQLKEEAQELAQDLKKEDANPTLTAARNANTELDEISEELDAHPDSTRMPQKLAQHEKRERERAAEIFKRLGVK